MAIEIMPVRISGVWLAIPAGVVQEVVGQQRFIAVPNALAAIPGVLPWRGRAIALVDIVLVTGLGPGLGASLTNEPAPRHVVLQTDDCTLALPVEAVREVQTIADAEVRPQDATHMRFSSREVQLEGALMPLLDVDELMQSLARTDG
jgi:chemotaxis signal transduction protein